MVCRASQAVRTPSACWHRVTWMYPGTWGAQTPNKPAVIMATTGESITYRELDEQSNQLVRLLHDSGLRRGDHIAVLLENHLHFMTTVWAALRSGMYVTAINWHLATDEAAYIVENCEARVLLSSAAQAALADPIDSPHVERRLMFDRPDDVADRWEDYATTVSHYPTSAVAKEPMGDAMLYSSGTTGRPKGVLRSLPDVAFWDLSPKQQAAIPNPYGFGPDTIYLSPAPLYHAAPLAFCRRVHMFGGAIVVMDKFEATAALQAIERYRCTHSQWVPTMFVRLLDLPDEVKAHHDLSTHRVAVHAAAPCPVEVKQQMMEWWGPIIWEYYAGSEGFGRTGIQPQEWLEHPGSVGSADPERVFILDDDGNALPRSETGGIYFKPDVDFVYKGDPEKTAGATSPQGYITYGDVGHIDQDGYLYLTDRKSFMIISGGVNIYPREAEDVLIGHPAILDVGVFGIPHPDLGEEVKAAVELQPGFEPSADLETDIVQFCRDRLSSFKCPRSVDFMAELPRLPAGKLRKGDLRKPYWS